MSKGLDRITRIFITFLLCLGVMLSNFQTGIVKAASTDSTLEALSLSSGTLSPTFASGTISYTASVTYSVTSVTVSATPTDAGETITVNGSSLSTPVNLAVGDNTISVYVESQDASTNHTYTITVNRAVASTEATLSTLSLSTGTLSPGFASGTTSYSANVAYGVTSVTVSATPTESHATITVNGSSLSTPVVLSVGSNPITVHVLAQDGVSDQDYTIAVTRAAASTDATLSALSLSSGALSPGFASGTTSYTASVAYSVTSVTVVATPTESHATITVNGSSLSTPINLSVGSNPITVHVLAEDGISYQNYTVDVTRAGSPDATLSALSLSSGTLSPGFASGTTSYSANVAFGVTSVTVSATPTESHATITVNGSSLSTPVNLNVGVNNITVHVLAENGVASQDYTIDVTRAGSPDATLSTLSLSTGTLSPGFASGTTSYTASVAHSVTSVTVSATPTESHATITVNGSSLSTPVNLNVGSNTITIHVLAQDGVSSQDYTISVTRAAASTDATLSNLTVSPGSLNETFSSSTIHYTVDVDNPVTSITVTPTKQNANATVTVNGASPSTPVTLTVGDNTITVYVLAEDGVTNKTYTIIVNRAPPPSQDADLSSLLLNHGLLSPAFRRTQTSYTVTVSSRISSILFTPTLHSNTAHVTVNGKPDSTPVTLTSGANVVTILVTAADNTHTMTYTVTVTQLTTPVPPRFMQNAKSTATVGMPYTYDIYAISDDTLPIHFSHGTLPDWLTFTDHCDVTETFCYATLAGTPAFKDHGRSATIIIYVANNYEDAADQTFIITVAPQNSLYLPLATR